MPAVQPQPLAAVLEDPEERIRALREAQARLRALIDNEPECVKLLDAQGRLLEMNAAGLRMIEADDPGQVSEGAIEDYIRERGADHPLERLSRRELQVLKLIVEGHTSSQVGALLGLSPKSIDASLE